MFWLFAIVSIIGCKKAPIEQVQMVYAQKGVFLRANFDTDPSSFVGRFIKVAETDINEVSAMEMPCSQYITSKIVDSGGTTRDMYYTASRTAAGNLGIPGVLQMGGSGEQNIIVRVKYTEAFTMQYEIADPVGYEACCLSAPNQCTDSFIGQFSAGSDGEIFYSMGTSKEAKANGITSNLLADLDYKDGEYWKSTTTWTKPVYFSFRLTDNIISQRADSGFQTGKCSEVEWDDLLPESSQGKYFVGTSHVTQDEASARENALLDAKQQATRYLKENIAATQQSSSSSTSGVESSSSVEAEASAAIKLLKDKAYCDENVPALHGFEYKYKVLTFLPKTAVTPE